MLGGAMSNKRSIDRRTALKGLGASLGLPLLKGCGPDVPAPPVTFEALRERIDTVVILMMENRSFDHVLGALSLEEGRTDIDGLTALHANPDQDGNPVVVFPATIDCLSDPPHSWSSSHRQFNDGANDGFVTEMGARNSDVAEHVMG